MLLEKERHLKNGAENEGYLLRNCEEDKEGPRCSLAEARKEI